MTRKDYVLIADVLKDSATRCRELNNDHGTQIIAGVARKFADRLGNENPAFDVARFMKAAGVQQ